MTQNDIAAARKKKLQKAVIDAAMALFAHTGSAGFRLPVPNTEPQLFVACDTIEGLRELVRR